MSIDDADSSAASATASSSNTAASSATAETVTGASSATTADAAVQDSATSAGNATAMLPYLPLIIIQGHNWYFLAASQSASGGTVRILTHLCFPL
jgi:CCR4-NOT transcriptional regulation complex NOT5 subunit